MLEKYAETFGDPLRAEGYRNKFQAGLRRRLSHAREVRCLKKALSLAGEAASGVVVDVPCGAGRFTPLLCRRSALYMGFDFAFPMVRLGRREAGSARAFAQASAWALPLEDVQVDLVVCIRLSHHCREEERLSSLVAELCRVAAKAVIISFLDQAAPKQVLHRAKQKIFGRPPRRPMWSRPTLARAAGAAGFSACRYFSLSPWFSGQTLALLLREEEA